MAKDDRNDNNSQDQLWLRIIQINDVYELDNYPYFKTLVDAKKKGNDDDPENAPDKTLVVLSGDFLGPSLLSSLDKGRSMVDIMMSCGITHVCFGNHVSVFCYTICL